jgi:hypothetical protein
MKHVLEAFLDNACAESSVTRLIANAMHEAEMAFLRADTTRRIYTREIACYEARGFAMLFLAHYLRDELNDH